MYFTLTVIYNFIITISINSMEIFFRVTNSLAEIIIWE